MTHPESTEDLTVTATADPRRWYVLAVLCLAVTIIFVDETILNVVLPDLVKDLHSSTSELQWAVDAYLIVYASLLFPAGNLGDRYGRKKLLLIGLVIFGVGSVFAMEASSPGWLIGGRVIMGLGGAAMLPTTLSIIVHTFPEHERTQAIGIWAAASGIGILTGPILAGWLLTHFWWGSVFLVNLPLVAIGIVGTIWIVTESKDPSPHPIDKAGSAMIVVGLAASLYAVIEWPVQGATSPLVIAAFIIGISALYGFTKVSRRAAQPTFDLTVFESPTIRASSLVMAVGFAAIVGSSFVISQYIQLYQGRSPILVAIVFGITTAGWGLAAISVPKLTTRIGTRAVIAGGMLVAAGSYGAMALFAHSKSLFPIAVAAFFQGVGSSGAITIVTDRVMAELPVERSGMASALNDAARQIGAAVGVAILGSVLATMYGRWLPDTVTGAARANFAHAVDAGTSMFRRASGAFVGGYTVTMVVCAAASAVAAGYVAVMRWPVVTHETTRPVASGDAVCCEDEKDLV